MKALAGLCPVRVIWGVRILPFLVLLLACPIGQAADQLILACSDARTEAIAVRHAPHGARHVGRRLEVGWAGGRRVFDSDPSCDDSIGGPCWAYCEYNPELKVTLLFKEEGDLFTGVLADRRHYLAWEHSDGQLGDTLKLYRRDGALVWEGEDTIRSRDGESVIGRFADCAGPIRTSCVARRSTMTPVWR